jgi:CemA family
MDSFPFAKFGQYWRKANQWFSRTADRALDEAYKATLKIKAIEDEHFGGSTIIIPPEYAGNQVASYFQNDLNKYLNIARLRLAEFQTSRTITSGNNPNSGIDSQGFDRGANTLNPYMQDIELEARILEKLRFIDEVLTRYADRQVPGDYLDRAIDRIMTPLERAVVSNKTSIPLARTNNPNQFNLEKLPRSEEPGDLTIDNNDLNKPLIDPSLIKTFRRIKRDLDPQSEVEMIQSYRLTQSKTRTSIRYVLLLILVPLLVHFCSKIIFVGPLVDLYRTAHPTDVFLNVNLESEAMEEIERFEKNLKFQRIAGIAPKMTEEQAEEKVKEKAEEVKLEFYSKSGDAVKNWFADLLSMITFSFLIINGKSQIAILKSFIDDIISGLSDTAKAFIIILVTDTFVGYHSPHGWEVILEGLAKHLGIPENNEFNSLFIATIPVLMDTMFKYWIFRYLTGQSPSSVATYKSMNE